jgi:alcohol dehydrogenase, propanol-preferring
MSKSRARKRGNRHRPQRKKSARYRECKISRPCPKLFCQAPDIREQLTKLTGKGVDIVIDCVDAENTTRDAFRLLNKGGALVVVGMFGNEVKIPLVPAIVNVYQVQFSLWGNYNELCEVIELAKQGKISHSIQQFPLSEINKVADMLRNGEIKGRAVIVPK